MSDFYWDKKIIHINGKSIRFEKDILEAKELNGVVFVVTVPEEKVLDNLFGIAIDTEKIWRVQSLGEVYPTFSQTPYVGISVIDNEVLAIDFCGCRFIIDPLTGKIMGRASETR